MRSFFEPASGPSWLKQVLSSIRAALGDIWPAPLRLKDYATADLPTAADFTGGLAWNVTSLTITWSNGSAWKEAQPSDATLTALAAFNTNGFLVQTAADTFAGRTLTAPAAGITIANPAGTAGDPTFALANDLAAVEALTGTGIARRTGADAWELIGYEPSTFTPSLKFGGGTTGMTCVQAGRYTKIGNTVIGACSFSLTTKGSSTGAATITGLPFTSGSAPLSTGSGLPVNLATVASVLWVIQPGGTTVTLYDGQTGTLAALNDTDFADGCELYFSFAYPV